MADRAFLHDGLQRRRVLADDRWVPSRTLERLDPQRQHLLLLSSGRAAVLVLMVFPLLDLARTGPLGPPAVAWLLGSAVVVALVSQRGRAPRLTEPIVAAVDAAVFIAVSVSAPAGYAPGVTLGIFLLVQASLRWGLRGVALVCVPIAVAATLNPTEDAQVISAVLPLIVVQVTVVAMALVLRSVRARQRALREQSDSLLALTFEHSPAGAAVTDATGVLHSANAALARWCGLDADDLVGRRPHDLVTAEDAGALDAALEPRSPASAHVEVRLLTPAGPHWVRLLAGHVAAAGTLPALCVVQVEDVDERRATAERLRLEALHDALTGLPNRRAITAELEELLATPGREGTLLMLDLDGFKAVNDRLGHDAGDELLQVVADRLRSCLRPGDVAGRLAGDEFVVIARGAPDDLAQRVLDTLVGPASLRAGNVALRASIGHRRITGSDHDVRAVVRDADAALYRAKHDGGCGSRVAEPGEGDVRDALPAPGPPHGSGSDAPRTGTSPVALGHELVTTL